MDKICNECGIKLGGSYMIWGDKKSGEEFYCFECECKLTGCEFCEESDRKFKDCPLSEEQHSAIKAIYFKDLDERMKHIYEYESA